MPSHEPFLTEVSSAKMGFVGSNKKKNKHAMSFVLGNKQGKIN